MDNYYLNTLTSVLFKVKKTQIEMLLDRNFKVDNDELEILHMTPNNFLNTYTNISNANNTTIRNSLSRIYKNNTKKNNVYVFYPETVKDGKKICMAQMVEFFKYINTHDSIRHIIIISELPVNNKVQEQLDLLSSYNIEFFLYSSLVKNPSKHFFVPKHEILSHSEAVNYLKINNLNLSQLPRIAKNDPIVLYLGAKPGDIIRITRENIVFREIVNTQIIHRYVTLNLLPPSKSHKTNK